MKILFCHNYYQQRGGEDLSFEADVDMLRERGHEVRTYVLHNDQIGKNRIVRTALKTVWNATARNEVQSVMAEFNPDILHCNNLFPQISPAIYQSALRHGVPVVQALRNYRAFCANAFFYRENEVCTLCHHSRFHLAGIRHRCYRSSFSATAVVTMMQLVHQSIGTYRNAVDMFFTPSAFARDVYIQGGFDPGAIAVKPNFVDPDPGIGSGDGNYAVFVGRLSPEKGIQCLLDAWNRQTISLPLRIVGDGPLMDVVESAGKQIECLGHRSREEVLDVIGRATVLVMPSQWYETFGRTIAESFSRGTPVIASDLGAMAELVKDGVNGYLFKSGDAKELAEKVELLVQGKRDGFRAAARQSYLDQFTSVASYEALMHIYDRAKERQSCHR